MAEAAERPQPKITLTEGFLVGGGLVIVSLVNLIPVAGDITSPIAGGLMFFYLYRKGLWGSNIIAVNAVGYVAGMIPIAQEFPTELAAWIVVIAIDRFPKLEEITEKVGEKVEGGEVGAAGGAAAAEGAAAGGAAVSATEGAVAGGAAAEGISAGTAEIEAGAPGGGAEAPGAGGRPSEAGAGEGEAPAPEGGEEGEKNKEEKNQELEEEITAGTPMEAPEKEAERKDFPEAGSLSGKPDTDEEEEDEEGEEEEAPPKAA